jgi:hypothetical protein
MPAPDDKFDELRRRWIARHQHTFLFQKRRAELLARDIRDRVTEHSGARVDPADDDVIHPLLARPATTIYGARDLLVVVAAAVLAPLGWFFGRLAYFGIVQLIPAQLRSYPVAALMWAAVATGLPLPPLYAPGGSLVSALVVPWVLAQVPAVFLAAGIYGIVNGWLAVDGRDEQWS